MPKIPKIPTLIRNDAQKPLKTHSCPIDVLVLFYASLIPQRGDFSGATLGVRSVALLQVPKLLDSFDTKKLLCRRFLQYIIRKCCNNTTNSCIIHDFSLPLRPNWKIV